MEEISKRLVTIFEKNFCEGVCSAQLCLRTKRDIGRCLSSVVLESWELREGLLDAIRLELEKLYPVAKLPISS